MKNERTHESVSTPQTVQTYFQPRYRLLFQSLSVLGKWAVVVSSLATSRECTGSTMHWEDVPSSGHGVVYTDLREFSDEMTSPDAKIRRRSRTNYRIRRERMLVVALEQVHTWHTGRYASQGMVIYEAQVKGEAEVHDVKRRSKILR